MDNIQRLEQQADLLFQNIAGWENSTLQRIGKRINQYSKLSIADVKAINNIAIVKQDMDAITKELARITGLNISQIEKIYGDLIAAQHSDNKPLYDYRGKRFVPFAENKELQSLVRAYAKATAGEMLNLSKTKLWCVRDQRGRFVKMQKGYTDILDKAVTQVATGASDFHTAMRESIVQLGGGGLRVDYGGGVTRRLDTVVRQNLLWGAKQVSTEYNEMVGEELGCDGIEIDWHSNPRPSHEFMQGKQYVLGKSRTVNGVYFESADEALERLKDYGCLHFKTPIICGISEPIYSPEELKRLNDQNARTYDIDGKTVTGYEATQMQRRLETAIREQKGIKTIAQASGDALQVRRCNERIKLYQDKYNQISEITGIAKEPKRMSAPKVNQFNPGSEKGITSKRRFLTEENKVNTEYISSKEYKNKFYNLPYNDNVKNSIYEQSKAILTHRNGTYYEDICLIDAKTGEIKAKSYNNKTENEVFYSDKALKIANENKGGLISVHNHGTNNPPTGSDIVSASGKQYQIGVVVCHDGSVYAYKPAKKVFSRFYFDTTVDKYKKLGYSEKESIIKVLSEFSNNFGLEWEELK